MTKPVCYQLVGIPASGKSTWIERQQWIDPDKWMVISTDKHVEEYAVSQGKTYSEVFHEYMPTAVELMAEEVVLARETDKSIIWDQTSTTVNSRRRKFKMLPDYDHIAVVFPVPPEEELRRRLKSRPGKEIPWMVVDAMIAGFEMPTEDEGFTEIILLED